MFREEALLEHWLEGSEPGELHAEFWLVNQFMPILICSSQLNDTLGSSLNSVSLERCTSA